MYFPVQVGLDSLRDFIIMNLKKAMFHKTLIEGETKEHLTNYFLYRNYLYFQLHYIIVNIHCTFNRMSCWVLRRKLFFILSSTENNVLVHMLHVIMSMDAIWLVGLHITILHMKTLFAKQVPIINIISNEWLSSCRNHFD